MFHKQSVSWSDNRHTHWGTSLAYSHQSNPVKHLMTPILLALKSSLLSTSLEWQQIYSNSITCTHPHVQATAITEIPKTLISLPLPCQVPLTSTMNGRILIKAIHMGISHIFPCCLSHWILTNSTKSIRASHRSLFKNLCAFFQASCLPLLCLHPTGKHSFN